MTDYRESESESKHVERFSGSPVPPAMFYGLIGAFVGFFVLLMFYNSLSPFSPLRIFG